MILKISTFSIFFSYLFISSAHAYIDPGTFSIVLQAIIGAIAAAGVTVKIFWYKFKSFFKKKDKDKSD